jgi:hypothetical protein
MSLLYQKKSGQFKDVSRSGGLLEAAEVFAEVVAVLGVPRVADDHLTALALGETPVDDVLAQRTSGGLHVSVAEAIGGEGASVEDFDGAAGAVHLGVLAVERCHSVPHNHEKAGLATYRIW